MNCKTGIYVDIFPLDDVPRESSLIQNMFTKMIKTLSSILLDKIGFFENKNLTLKHKLKCIIFKPYSSIAVHKWQDWLMSFWNGKESKYYVNYGSNYNTIKQTIPKKVYEPFRQLEFEKKYFMAPSNPEYILARIYGKNYMNLPPIEKRITHNPVKISFNTSNQSDTDKGDFNDEKI